MLCSCSRLLSVLRRIYPSARTWLLGGGEPRPRISIPRERNVVPSVCWVPAIRRPGDPPLQRSFQRHLSGPASHWKQPQPSRVGARTGECSGRASPHEPGIRGPTAVASCPLQGTCPGAWHARLRCPPAQAWGQRTSVGREMESFSPLPPRVWVRGRGEKLVLLRRRCLDLMAEDLAMIDGGWERGGDDGITRGEQSPARCCEPPHRGSYRFGPRET
jgi:hypothetical protein